MKRFFVGGVVRCVVLAMTGGLVMAADGPKSDRAADRAALQGTWQVVEQQMRGGPGPGDPREQQMIFAGETFKLVEGDKVFLSGTFTVDPSRTPRVMEMKVSEGAGTDHAAPVHGIYELKGQELVWCAGEPGSEARPVKFDTKGTTNVMIKMKRASGK
jgi:uncharacterized protein (TIGR03067 family)